MNDPAEQERERCLEEAAKDLDVMAAAWMAGKGTLDDLRATVLSNAATHFRSLIPQGTATPEPPKGEGEV